MKHLTNTCGDYLRAIPNAEQLIESLDEIYAYADGLSFLCYDIQSLRKINRVYGRKVGDALLAAVAEWVVSLPLGALYRIESDQFCVVFDNLDAGSVFQYAIDMEKRFAQPWRLSVMDRGYDIFVQVSIAIIEDLKRELRNELLELQDQALEMSKKEQQIILFTEEDERSSREKLHLQTELKRCILSDMQGFHLAFQPLVNPVTCTWRGLEALCRWTSPLFGRVSPGVFIEEVEEIGLIHQMGTWVLNKAIGTCKKLRLDEIEQFYISVNVSALQLNQRDYVRTVIDALERYQYPPNKLMLEITESAQFSFNLHTMESIATLRAMGVMFALDDFGSGYSGFSNLKNLPVDMLKTDREFVENIESDTYLQYFYYIMSETAHANNMRMIAEGVETREQLLSVMKNGADIIQGYLFGKPMDSNTIDHLRDNFTIPMPGFNANMPDMMDFKQWMSSQNAYMITPSLFGLQSKCIDHIWNENNVEDALYKIMETVGTHFNASRVYVFLREEGTIFSEKSEWCAEGVASQTHLFQRLDGAADGFYQLLEQQDVVFAIKEAQLPLNLRKRLEAAGENGEVQSIVAMPMKRNGEILGFVGYDSSSERTWLPEEFIILQNICLLCMIVLANNGVI